MFPNQENADNRYSGVWLPCLCMGQILCFDKLRDEGVLDLDLTQNQLLNSRHMYLTSD